MQRPTFLIVITLLCLTVTQAIAAAQSSEDKPKPNARKAAYIVGSDVAAAQSFDKLLEDEGFNVELIGMDEVDRTDWKSYGLVIIGSDVGRRPAGAEKIAASNTPVLALGEGGYSFLGQLKQPIGSPRGWHGARTGIVATSAKFWDTSPIDLPKDRTLELYTSSRHVGIHLPRIPEKTSVIGREVRNETHYPIVEYDSRFMLWGFTGSPKTMTETGKAVFIHACKYLTGPAGPMPEVRKSVRPQ